MLKKLDFELMRIVACFFVIFNHTGQKGFFLFSTIKDRESLEFWLYLFISVFDKFAVPLFFAISGALMLGREPEPLGKLWKNRVLKIFLVLLAWSLFYYLSKLNFDFSRFDIAYFARMFYANPKSWNLALWYMYAYLAMLISLPLLQRLVKNMTGRDFLYMFAVALFYVSVAPVFQYLMWQDKAVMYHHLKPSWLYANVVLYPCIGYFLHARLKEFWDWKRLSVLWLVNVMAIGLCAYMTYYKAGVTGVLSSGKSQAFHMTYTMLNCATVFASCQYFCDRHKFGSLAEKGIRLLGSCTFGIYLLHIFVKDHKMLTPLWNVLLENLSLNPMLACFIYVGVVMVIGFAVTLVMKKIPVLRRLVT